MKKDHNIVEHHKHKGVSTSHGGAGSGDDGSIHDLTVRVAKLESDVAHILQDLTDIKADLRRLDTKMDTNDKRLEDKMDSTFKWIIGTFLIAFVASFGGLALMMAHGFHWL